MKKALSLILTLALCLSAAVLAGCSGKSDSKVIRVGASSTPHAEILREVSSVLKEQGYTLKVIEYDDYVLPNTALEDGSLDANYFQHTPYLNSFNSSNKTHLVGAAKIHYEPFGLYGNGVSDLKSVPAGTTILIPADDSNETRALFLLAQEGLITLPEDASAEKGITTLDIKDSKGYKIVEIAADMVPAQFANSDKGTLAVINGNYALQAGIKISDALATEDASGDAAQTYANVIAVKSGNENSDKIKALIEALQSEKIRDFIASKYNGAVVAIF